MTTTDANGIIRWESTDPITPLEATLNAGMDSVSAAITGAKKGSIHYVANTTERAAVVLAFAPTASKPLYVHRADAGLGRELERTLNGTDWLTIPAQETGSLTLVEGWGAYEGAPGWIRHGRIVRLTGGVIRTAATANVGATTPFGVATAPASISPGVNKRIGSAASYSWVLQARYQTATNQIALETSASSTLTQNVWWASLEGYGWVL